MNLNKISKLVNKKIRKSTKKDFERWIDYDIKQAKKQIKYNEKNKADNR